MDTIVCNNEAGNLTTERQGYSCQYDYENRIVKITRGQTDIVEFWYDALGRRVKKLDHVTAGNTRWYYYDKDWRVVDEFRKPATFLVPKQVRDRRLKRPAAADLPLAGFGLTGGRRHGRISGALTCEVQHDGRRS
ncbi:MAG TPA: hypothetical protein ENN81_09385 [Phycisphaerales bacterium]|nr:hypothetical protein [Phycisphaerales bacterium]